MQKEQQTREFPNRFRLIVSGNGLEKAGIKDGTIVTCEKTDTASEGDIVFASTLKDGRESFSLSRYREINGTILLCSETDDKSFLPFVSAPRTDVKIYGKVISY